MTVESLLGLPPRIGVRYGPAGVWYLRPETLFLEQGNKLIKAHIKQAGWTPRVPSLKAAVNGIHISYENGPVMGT